MRLLCLSALRLAQQPTYSPTCLRNSKAAKAPPGRRTLSSLAPPLPHHNRCQSPGRADSFAESPSISRYLLASPHIFSHLPVSPGIPRYPAVSPSHAAPSGASTAALSHAARTDGDVNSAVTWYQLWSRPSASPTRQSNRRLNACRAAAATTAAAATPAAVDAAAQRPATHAGRARARRAGMQARSRDPPRGGGSPRGVTLTV